MVPMAHNKIRPSWMSGYFDYVRVGEYAGGWEARAVPGQFVIWNGPYPYGRGATRAEAISALREQIVGSPIKATRYG